MLCSIDRLKSKSINSYCVVDLETFNIIPSNYTKDENINSNYSLLVKTKDKIYFHTVSDRPFYDEPVYLSMGDFIKINRKECTYFTNK